MTAQNTNEQEVNLSPADCVVLELKVECSHCTEVAMDSLISKMCKDFTRDINLWVLRKK